MSITHPCKMNSRKQLRVIASAAETAVEGGFTVCRPRQTPHYCSPYISVPLRAFTKFYSLLDVI